MKGAAFNYSLGSYLGRGKSPDEFFICILHYNDHLAQRGEAKICHVPLYIQTDHIDR